MKHPGTYLRKELDKHGMTQRMLSNLLDMPYTVVNEVINGKRRISLEYALLFSASLGVEHAKFLSLQNDYDIARIFQDKDFVKHLNTIRKIVVNG